MFLEVGFFNRKFCLAIEAFRSLNRGKEKERVYPEERANDPMGSKKKIKQKTEFN